MGAIQSLAGLTAFEYQLCGVSPPPPPQRPPTEPSSAIMTSAVQTSPPLDSFKQHHPVMEVDVKAEELPGELQYVQYEHALESKYLPAIRALISKDLSEPYSIYVYRYFLCQWSHLCFMALSPVDHSLIGVIVCKLEVHAAHSTPTRRGYIAMLAVASPYRGHGVATALVKRAIAAMASRKADEIVLETEESNLPAMRLYERLGFLRSKKLHRYYLNGSSAYRLVLLLRSIDPDANAGALDGDEVI